MGMYDKDENFGDHFNPGDRFVVMAAHYDGEIDTKFGKAKKTTLTLVTRNLPKEKVRYMALGEGFAAQAQRADDRDFPHVAEYVREARAGGNEVKLLAKVDVTPGEYINAGVDGPPLSDKDVFAQASNAFHGSTEEREGDDLVF